MAKTLSYKALQDISELSPEYSMLVVSGDKVSPQQAGRVILRTTDYAGIWMASEHSPVARAAFEALFGSRLPQSKGPHKIAAAHGALAVSQLDNHRVYSPYGSLFGWCDWDGTIFANSYSIGKYPYLPNVFEDLESIAKEFPFLKLKAQLMDRSAHSPNPAPIAEFHVSNGKVSAFEPKEIIAPLPDLEASKSEVLDEAVAFSGGHRVSDSSAVGLRQFHAAVEDNLQDCGEITMSE